MRICNRCVTGKPLADFGRSSHGSLKLVCKKCEAEAAARRRAADPEKARRIRRESAAVCKIIDPGRVKAHERATYRRGGKEKQARYARELREKRPFEWRAKLLRRVNPTITATDLEALWERQGGLCGLTGRPLDHAKADIDHIVPVSRGGGHDLGNLRWVTRRANRAKGNMTDQEFFELCQDVLNHRGK